jgi:hypothetical protein
MPSLRRAPAPPRGAPGLDELAEQRGQLRGELLAGDHAVEPVVERLRRLPEGVRRPAEHRRGASGGVDLAKRRVLIEIGRGQVEHQEAWRIR